MWRASKRFIIDFLTNIGHCINPRRNLNDLDDISVYEIEDDPAAVQYPPVNFQPETFRPPVEEQQQCEPLQHRPDAPGIRRNSPPEIVVKVRQAIQEMMIEGTCENAKGDHTFNMYHEPLIKW